MRRIKAFLFIRPKVAARAPGTALRRLRDLVTSVTSPGLPPEGAKSVQPTGPRGMRPGYPAFGIISADRHEQTAAQRAEARSLLKKVLSAHGLGYVQQTGIWHELVHDSLGPAQMKIPVRELSFVIFGPTLAKMRALCRQFNQESIIYSGPETNGEVMVVGANDSFSIGNFKVIDTMPKDMQDHLHENRSEIKDHTYVFASYPALLRPRTR